MPRPPLLEAKSAVIGDDGNSALIYGDLPPALEGNLPLSARHGKGLHINLVSPALIRMIGNPTRIRFRRETRDRLYQRPTSHTVRVVPLALLSRRVAKVEPRYHSLFQASTSCIASTFHRATNPGDSPRWPSMSLPAIRRPHHCFREARRECVRAQIHPPLHNSETGRPETRRDWYERSDASGKVSFKVADPDLVVGLRGHSLEHSAAVVRREAHDEVVFCGRRLTQQLALAVQPGQMATPLRSGWCSNRPLLETDAGTWLPGLKFTDSAMVTGFPLIRSEFGSKG